MEKEYTEEELREAIEVKSMFDQLELLIDEDVTVVKSYNGAVKGDDQIVFGTLKSVDRYNSITLSHRVTSDEVCGFFSKIFLKEISCKNSHDERAIVYKKKSTDFGKVINDAISSYVKLSPEETECFLRRDYIDQYVESIKNVKLNKSL